MFVVVVVVVCKTLIKWLLSFCWNPKGESRFPKYHFGFEMESPVFGVMLAEAVESLKGETRAC